MATPQSGIVPESGDYAVYLTLTLPPDADLAALRRVLSGTPKITAALARETGETSLASVVAIGAAVWPRLFTQPKPADLVPFAAIQDGGRLAPATPADLFIHIHANRQAACFHLARRLMESLGKSVALVEEVHGFRNFEARDLTGFIDGTENPKGADVPEVAIIGADDAAFAGGSFVGIQRYIHDLARWEKQSVAEQEGVIGRTKKDSVEYDDDRKPPTAHIARVVIEENGEELEILRRGLPYGDTHEAGIYFVAYGATPHNFRKMLTRMMVEDVPGHHDHLMNFTHAVTGAAFFAPSVELLERMG